MLNITDEDVFTVFAQLKDKYSLFMTTSQTFDPDFTDDFPLLVGKAHGLIILLYNDYGMFVMDVMDDAQTKGTHWHPLDVETAIEDIIKFMEGKEEYELLLFPIYRGLDAEN